MTALLAIVALSAAPVAEAPYEQSSYELPQAKAATDPDQRLRTAPEGSGVMELPKGPSWTYRPRRGAMVEVAALGGAIQDAPSLAHVAFNWKF